MNKMIMFTVLCLGMVIHVAAFNGGGDGSVNTPIGIKGGRSTVPN